MASTSGLFTGYGQPTISIKQLAGDSGDFDQWQNQIQSACPFTHANLLSPDAQAKFDELLEERDTLLAKEGDETMKNQTLVNYRESVKQSRRATKIVAKSQDKYTFIFIVTFIFICLST